MLTTLTAAVLAPRYHLHNIRCISGKPGLVTESGHKAGEKIHQVYQAFPEPQLYFSRGHCNKNFRDLATFRAIFSHIFTMHAQKWIF